MPTVPRPPVAAGMALGIGLGGFVDGIVLHQILQWHHMLSSTRENPMTTVAGLERNTLADGLFHAFSWFAVTLGVVLLWRHLHATTRPPAGSGRSLTGWVLVGWGAFNVVEGIVNHQLLRIHHVRTDVSNVAAWDVAFLAFGASLVLAGWLLQRGAQRAYDAEPAAGRRAAVRR